MKFIGSLDFLLGFMLVNNRWEGYYMTS